MKQSIAYGTQTIEYALTFAERKTLGVTVLPDTSVEVVAPLGTEIETIEAKLRPRRRWIVQQQAELAQFLPIVPPREYVSGETHLYLGRQYRLKVVEADVPSVKLVRGRFVVCTADRTETHVIQTQLETWYRRHAHPIFDALLGDCMVRVKRVGIVERPSFAIRKMEKRWGSCTAGGQILLNLKLIQAPKHLISYVILHELCHLKEHNHSAAYYVLLGRVLPAWRERKKQLSLLRVA